MYKRNECLIETLKPKAEHLARKGGNPKEILDTCSYLQFFPAMRGLRQTLVMKAYDELENSRNSNFEVYRLLCEQSVELFLKDHSTWHPGISLFALRRMSQTKRDKKHQRIINSYSAEMKELVSSEILMATV